MRLPLKLTFCEIFHLVEFKINIISKSTQNYICTFLNSFSAQMKFQLVFHLKNVEISFCVSKVTVTRMVRFVHYFMTFICIPIPFPKCHIILLQRDQSENMKVTFYTVRDKWKLHLLSGN